VIASISEEHNIPAENLLTPDYLRQMAWEPPAELSATTVGDALSALGARPWQVELLANLLAEALAAPTEDVSPEVI
jgi:ribonuclease D